MLPRVRALFARVVQYTSLSYHPMYFIMYGSIYEKRVRERSHRAAHVPKRHLLEKAIPLFLPLQIPQTQFYKVVHDYTIDAESLVFSRIFRTWLRCILQGKTRPHKFESFSRCQKESTALPCFPFLKKGCPEKEEARRFCAGLCCDHRRTDERGVSARDPIWESWDRSSAGPQQRKERYQRQSDICSAAYRRWRTPPA